MFLRRTETEGSGRRHDRSHLTHYEHAEQQSAIRTGTLLEILVFVRDVIIN